MATLPESGAPPDAGSGEGRSVLRQRAIVLDGPKEHRELYMIGLNPFGSSILAFRRVVAGALRFLPIPPPMQSANVLKMPPSAASAFVLFVSAMPSLNWHGGPRS